MKDHKVPTIKSSPPTSAELTPQESSNLNQQLIIRQLGLSDYQTVWSAMQQFTDSRGPDQKDEIWWLQHPKVFTQGQAGKAEHVLAPGDIPVIQVDRGGQVTYHGPGQLVGYLLINLKRRHLGVRDLVTAMEESIVAVLSHFDIQASPRPDAPGVYINAPAENANEAAANDTLGTKVGLLGHGAKIAQLGLRVRRGCSFHGLSLNIDMDMEPFQRINPCGHIGMEVTSVAQQIHNTPTMTEISQRLRDELATKLGYTHIQELSDGQLPAL